MLCFRVGVSWQSRQAAAKPSRQRHTTLPISSSPRLSLQLSPNQTRPTHPLERTVPAASSPGSRDPLLSSSTESRGERGRTAAGRPQRATAATRGPPPAGRGDGAGYSQALRFLLLHQGDEGNDDINLPVLPSAFSWFDCLLMFM